jgi:hypothetical protein
MLLNISALKTMKNKLNLDSVIRLKHFRAIAPSPGNEMSIIIENLNRRILVEIR